MILATTIQTRLEKVHGSLYPDFDIRYLQRWIKLYSSCFPKFILNGNFECKFIYNEKLQEFRWEIHKTNN